MTVIKTVIKTVTTEQPVVRLIKRGNIYWSNLRLGHLSGRVLNLPDFGMDTCIKDRFFAYLFENRG